LARIKSKTETLTPRQQAALAALLERGTVVDAAPKAGVSLRTLFRWLQEPTFQRALREARGQALETALSSLQSASSDAVKALRDVLNDAAAKRFEKIAAAKAILHFTLLSHETLDVENRLAALEQRLEQRQRLGGRHG
jgi:hypothetical protein